jgi:hypothetical protein
VSKRLGCLVIGGLLVAFAAGTALSTREEPAATPEPSVAQVTPEPTPVVTPEPTVELTPEPETPAPVLGTAERYIEFLDSSSTYSGDQSEALEEIGAALGEFDVPEAIRGWEKYRDQAEAEVAWLTAHPPDSCYAQLHGEVMRQSELAVEVADLAIQWLADGASDDELYAEYERKDAELVRVMEETAFDSTTCS